MNENPAGPIRPLHVSDLTDAELLTDTAELLNEAARRCQATDGRPDFADFLARAVVAAAANVGGTEQLLPAGVHSWEALLVTDLIDGSRGVPPKDWLSYRTEPVVVPLNVAELIETHPDHPGLLGIDDALDTAHIRHCSADGNSRIGQDVDQATYMRDLDQIERRYKTVYRQYADAFTETVHAEASRLTIPVPVSVLADADPMSRWWKQNEVHNPYNQQIDSDPGASYLWNHAHDTTPLPNVDIRVSGGLLS